MAEMAGIEVSASFLGRRNFNRFDAEDVAGEALAARLGIRYYSRRDGAVPPAGCAGWRLALDGVYATLMLRVVGRPLHRRIYKVHSIPGTLHPPVAAAMALLADIRPGHTVVDPCCGAGTLLIEAAHVQPTARLHGYDTSPEAITAARANAAATTVGPLADSGASARPGADSGATVGPGAEGARVANGAVLGFSRGDAGELPVAAGSVDRVVCNPPWGTQAGAAGVLARRPERWWSELRRVLAPNGIAVLLLPKPTGLAAAIRYGLAPVHVQRIRLSGAQPLIVTLRAEPRDPTTRRR
ncbi:MAG: methyltransferase domain-containing protein [Streptosporangiales bacterium]|nr:methyltransferase domain-containing protein [Streptosporangiales bacterium]